VKGVISSVRSVFPDLRLKVVEEIAEGDKVVASWVSTGTYLGEWESGIKPTGNRVTWTGISHYQLEEGKIVKEGGNEDGLSLLYQLGTLQTWKPPV
jgi:predicted ester cyclase